MSKKIQSFSAQVGGNEMKVETGRYAGRAHGACTVQYGDTVVLATACMSKAPREGIDFFPLMVDFEEKLYAAGKIKGSRFIKREGKSSDEAVLSGRMIDRAIRPLFDDSIKNDVQVVLTILSVDGENDPDMVGLVAASCVLSLSNIPWKGPIAGVRVGMINNEWVLNPSYEAREKSDLDLVVAGTFEKVIMLEASANEANEEAVANGIDFSRKHIGKIIDLIDEVTKKVGDEKISLADIQKVDEEARVKQEAVNQKVKEFLSGDKLDKILEFKSKDQFKQGMEDLKEEIDVTLKEDNEVSKDERKKALKLVGQAIEEKANDLVLKKNKRIDNRKMNEIRALSADVGVLPRTHGTGLFSRGETQVLSVVTLGSPSDEQILDTMEESGKKRYMHHYNFPGFSVGETSPMRGPGRRDIGHGALAEKALMPVLPSKEDFPYTIRVVSEVLSSNGSSSQASVCGSSLALMDAGVPIKKPVAGIAMGIVQNEAGDYKILTDLQDLEDSNGGMDFKVAGTRDGITAVQMDTKSDGLTMDMVHDTLKQALKARLEILDVMQKGIKEPRKELSQYAPRIHTMQINPDKIRDVIGPGGKIINKIIDTTGVAIDIEDSGLIFITSTSVEGADKAIEWIENLTKEVEAGEIYQGKVTRLMDFGAFVEVLPGQEGLVHVSEMAPFRVGSPSDAVSVGDEVPAKVKEIDDQGRINLTFIGTDFDFSKIKKSEQSSAPRGNFNGPRNKFRKFNRGGDRK
ncbi:MAG: polyribonucleotide nucleotidyltransferase [Patescibacteria group bacterium]